MAQSATFLVTTHLPSVCASSNSSGSFKARSSDARSDRGVKALGPQMLGNSCRAVASAQRFPSPLEPRVPGRQPPDSARCARRFPSETRHSANRWTTCPRERFPRFCPAAAAASPVRPHRLMFSASNLWHPFITTFWGPFLRSSSRSFALGSSSRSRARAFSPERIR